MHNQTNGRDPSTQSKRPYERPAVHSEKMFESSALACGKCVSGSAPQYQCGTVLANS